MPDQLSERHVLVVGGAGYVGSVLIRDLLASGARVRVLDSLLYDNAASIEPLLDRENFEFVCGDMRVPDEVAAALAEVTDVVVLAALVGDPVCKTHPDLAEETNLGGVRNVLDACDASPGFERLVFASTCSNYGLRPVDDEASEEDELHPLSLYAETKVAIEREILERTPGLSFSPTILRVSTAFGLSPRMRFDLTVSEFTRELALGNSLEVYDADTWRPYCHVEDISSAIRTVLAAPTPDVRGEVFNVGGEENNQTKRMIVEAAIEALDGEGEVEWSEGGTDARNYKVSFVKIRERLGYTPNRSVADGIAELIKAIRSGSYADVEDRPLFYRNYELDADAPGEGTGGGDAG